MSETDEEGQMTESTPHISYVADGQPIGLAVIEAVAAVSGRSPLYEGPTNEGVGNNPLDPLGEVIDPEALEAICLPKDDDRQTAKKVTFAYCGYEVAVESTGQITVVET